MREYWRKCAHKILVKLTTGQMTAVVFVYNAINVVVDKDAFNVAILVFGSC